MKMSVFAGCVAAVVAASSVVSAAEFRGPLFPVPVGPSVATPFVGFDHHEEAVKPVAEKIELYHCVKVEDPDHIACCAEPKLIQVPNPCWKPCGSCCEPRCVWVQICVPKMAPCHHHAPSCAAPAPGCAAPAPSCAAPVAHCCAPKCCDTCHACGCDHEKEKVTCRDGGRYQKYDYGKYRVEVRVKDNGWIVVDYDN